ncbi:hypothetical protein [Caballeronia pedi]|uniref:hypothetical protein n=1 Tax=Caballeronia pedi TaxID=1777141 RepID=UPI001FC9C7C4|nr:hypothetical protein [Caballeronia pedi]
MGSLKKPVCESQRHTSTFEHILGYKSPRRVYATVLNIFERLIKQGESVVFVRYSTMSSPSDTTLNKHRPSVRRELLHTPMVESKSTRDFESRLVVVSFDAIVESLDYLFVGHGFRRSSWRFWRLVISLNLFEEDLVTQEHIGQGASAAMRYKREPRERREILPSHPAVKAGFGYADVIRKMRRNPVEQEISCVPQERRNGADGIAKCLRITMNVIE